MATDVNKAVASAKAALSSANKFQHSVTGGKEDLAAKSDKPAASNYTHVREARKSPGEFMGVSSDQGSELKTALESRESAKKALEPNQ